MARVDGRLFLLALASLLASARPPAACAADPRRTLAVVDFAVRAQTAQALEHAWFGSAVSELLQAKLQLFAGARVLERQRVRSLLLAAGGGAGAAGDEPSTLSGVVPAQVLIAGSVSVDPKDHRRIRVQARAFETGTSKIVAEATFTGTGDLTGLLKIVEDLARTLADGLKLAYTPEQLAYAEPAKLDTLRFLVEGEGLLAAGRHRDAIAALQKAMDGNEGRYFAAALVLAGMNVPGCVIVNPADWSVVKIYQGRKDVPFLKAKDERHLLFAYTTTLADAATSRGRSWDGLICLVDLLRGSVRTVAPRTLLGEGWLRNASMAPGDEPPAILHYAGRHAYGIAGRGMEARKTALHRIDLLTGESTAVRTIDAEGFSLVTGMQSTVLLGSRKGNTLLSLDPENLDTLEATAVPADASSPLFVGGGIVVFADNDKCLERAETPVFVLERESGHLIGRLTVHLENERIIAVGGDRSALYVVLGGGSGMRRSHPMPAPAHTCSASRARSTSAIPSRRTRWGRSSRRRRPGGSSPGRRRPCT